MYSNDNLIQFLLNLLPSDLDTLEKLLSFRNALIQKKFPGRYITFWTNSLDKGVFEVDGKKYLYHWSTSEYKILLLGDY